MKRSSLVAMLALGFVGLTPVAATAETGPNSLTVSVGGRNDTTLIVEAGSGNVAANNVAIDVGEDNVYVYDSGQSMVAGPGCTVAPVIVGGGPFDEVATCDAATTYTVTTGGGDDTVAAGFFTPSTFALNGFVTLGQGNDKATVGRGRETVSGGSGLDEVSYSNHASGVTVTLDGAANDGAGENDTVLANVENVSGTIYTDTIYGSSVANVINGYGGVDSIFGKGGKDTLDGGSGADTLNGGSDIDTVTYANRSASLTVTPDDSPNDGESGEGDNVRSNVENLIGGEASDTFIGSSAANKLVGGLGVDTLHGEGGDDRLKGGEGNDTLKGGAGTDKADGGAGTDTCAAETETTCEV